jgi:hypothetical protein
MQGHKFVALFSLIMLLPITACAGNRGLQATGASASQVAAEKSNLQGRLDAAVNKERAGSRDTRVWTVHSFKVRKGVGVDGDLDPNLKGKVSVRGLHIEMRSANPSRNVALYLLHDLSDNTIEKVEIHDLDRYRIESELPVRMLGAADTGESLGIIRRALEKKPGGQVGERLVMAIGLHDDPQVESLLKAIVNGSYEEKEQAQAALWLGQLPGQKNFLEGLARNEQLSSEVRKQAVLGIGRGQSPGALSTLRDMFETVPNKEVKEQCLFAASLTEDKRDASAFLRDVKANSQNSDFRQQATLWLEHLEARRDF